MASAVATAETTIRARTDLSAERRIGTTPATANATAAAYAGAPGSVACHCSSSTPPANATRSGRTSGCETGGNDAVMDPATPGKPEGAADHLRASPGR